MNKIIWNGRIVIVTGLLLVAAALWMSRQWSLHQRRLALEQAWARETEMATSLAEQQKQCDQLKQEIEKNHAKKKTIKAEFSLARKEFERVNPDSAWAIPPQEWPNWSDSSPYVWIRKETLPNLNLHPFSNSGRLAQGIDVILDIPPDKLAALNEKLAKVVVQAKQRKFSSMERIINNNDGTPFDETQKVVLRIPSLGEEALRLEKEFNEVLTTELGEERARLLVQSDVIWVKNTFNNEGRLLSVELTKDGLLEVNSSSISGVLDSASCTILSGDETVEQALQNRLDPDLLPWFKSITLHGN
jgi:hypothetical protein